LIGAEPQGKPQRKTKRFYAILALAVLLITILLGTLIYKLTIANRVSFGPGPVEIEVTTDKPIYLQGEEINFTVYVTNPHEWQVPYPNSVFNTIEKNGSYVCNLGIGQIDYIAGNLATFKPDSKKAYIENLPWNQRISQNGTLVQVEPGKYTLTVEFSGAVDYGNDGNCTFEIR
jgi:hypothetical protein